MPWCTAGTATGTCTNFAPLSGKLGTTTQIYSTSDPFFVVPAAYLAPNPTNTAAYSMTFTLKITYSRNGSASYLTTTGNEPNATKPNVPVDQKTNALRVLVVPMGDPTSTSPQWSSTAETTLQDLMTNAARAFPVATGISPSLTANSTGGIRYVVSTTVLDAKALGLYKTASGLTKFCANGSITSGSWNTSQVTSGAYLGHTLKGDLLQRLADYNLTNAPPADIVLGVIDGANAWKSTDGFGCDDGRAATPASKAAGQVGWVRVSPDSTFPTPLQMELLHPFGESDQNLTFHSTNAEADGAEPDHGYNVLQRKVISTAAGALGTNDHSIMNYSTTAGAYTKDNTLLEPNDWGDALCNLGGVDSTPGPFANCTLRAALGTSQGVPAAAGRKFFQISGVLTGNNASPVRVTMAKADVPGDIETGVVDTSRLHLLLCEGPCSTASNVKDVGLALLPDEGHADGGAVSLGGANGFDAMVEMRTAPPLWTDAALKLDGATVFSSSASDPAPDVTGTSTVTPGTIVRSFTPYFSAGEFTTSLCCNGRSVAFDGTNLYLTVASNPEGSESDDNQRIFKATTSDGRILSSVVTGTTIGALAYNAGAGKFYGGDYTGNGNVYEITPGDGSKSALFEFHDTGSCLFEGGGDFIDGLEYRPTAGNLAVSGDACDTVYLKTLAGAAVGQFATDNNSGITTDGAGGLWLARLGGEVEGEATQLTHVDSGGNVLGEVTIDNYEAEDLAYDSVTFAPTCVVWMNEATFGSPEVRAVAVPCGAGGNVQGVESQTTNTKFASVFFTCGPPGNLTDDQPTFTIANGLRPDAAGSVVAEYTNQLFCGVGTPQTITEASNGWTSTGLNDPEAVQQVDAGTPDGRSPITNIASPLNGAKVRRGEFVHYEGSATDAEQEAITGANLKWYDDKLTPQLIGTGQSFDLRLAANSPLGDHHIKLEATDLQGHTTSSTPVTITIGPALCPSTSKCP